MNRSRFIVKMLPLKSSSNKELRKCVCAFVCVCVGKVGGGGGGGGGGRVIFLRGNGLHGRQPNMYLSTSYSTEISQSV